MRRFDRTIGILVIVLLQTPLAHARCTAARLVADVRDGDLVRREARVVACPPASPSSAPQSYGWQELAARIVWPARDAAAPVGGGGELRSFLLTDAHLPPVPVTMRLARGRAMAAGAAACEARAITLSGERVGEEAGSGAGAEDAVRDISVLGEGEALLCDGDAVPHAAALHVVRRVMPALWRAASPDQVIASEIDLAWAQLP